MHGFVSTAASYIIIVHGFYSHIKACYCCKIKCPSAKILEEPVDATLLGPLEREELRSELEHADV